MSAKLLEGKPIADKIKQGLRLQIQDAGISPVLGSILVGENGGAESYVRAQKKLSESLGISYQFHKLNADTAELSLIEFIQKLNNDKKINGIILQMPLPAHIDGKKMSNCILPEKDVEGMHPVNIGKLLFSKATIIPCTAAAVMELINSTAVDLYGKEAVIVGHSEIVGKPLALLLLEKFATVTVCHIGTAKRGKLEEHVRQAEVLIVAAGKPNLIKGPWVREGAVVIDVGINRVGDKIVGDVEFDEAAKRASWITPVPGGVGPLTATLLMRNLVEIAKGGGRR
jgi:methylenetetrahydrofolate dehydrogenase (NADP+)/methenyltetrahydrofolate cyclohydrolase